jgi:hypothetical protein
MRLSLYSLIPLVKKYQFSKVAQRKVGKKGFYLSYYHKNSLLFRLTIYCTILNLHTLCKIGCNDSKWKYSLFCFAFI